MSLILFFLLSAVVFMTWRMEQEGWSTFRDTKFWILVTCFTVFISLVVVSKYAGMP